MRFTKMHGLGNDYVYIDAWRDGMPDDLSALAIAVSDRHRGIGADGLIILCRPTDPQTADARMLMYNADGSQSEMCGNGLRCVAKLAYDHGHVCDDRMRFETGAGILSLRLMLEGRDCVGAQVLMGQPRLSPEAVPVRCEASGPQLKLQLRSHDSDWGLLAVGMGNPHAVTFIDAAMQGSVEDLDLVAIGPALEHADVFPNRSNIEFVQRLDDEDGLPVLRQRTWERGSGETEACGTGACATAVAAILSGSIDTRACIVRLNGGDLHISWPDDEAEVLMSGSATFVFNGVWPDLEDEIKVESEGDADTEPQDLPTDDTQGASVAETGLDEVGETPVDVEASDLDVQSPYTPKS